MNIVNIPAFSDNYIWCLYQTHDAIIVDPGQSKPVLDVLQTKNLSLGAILITHHHTDHTAGVKQLKQVFPDARVYAPAYETSPAPDAIPVGQDMCLDFPELGIKAQVLETPGHTRGHVSYYIEGMLFCGDTLFAGGCGRLFEGTPEQMYHSLQRIVALDPKTKIFCAHEYTQANLRFCLTIEPNNLDLQQRYQTVINMRKQGIATVPSTLAQEIKTNVFLRTRQPQVQQSVKAYIGRDLIDDIDCFAVLRSWKDTF